MSLSVPYKKPKRPFDTSLQLDTYITFAVFIRPTHLYCCLLVMFGMLIT